MLLVEVMEPADSTHPVTAPDNILGADSRPLMRSCLERSPEAAAHAHQTERLLQQSTWSISIR